MIIGWCNGCFDLFHDGHRHLLRTAAARCELLYVAINSDASVRKLKGKSRPINRENTRISHVQDYLNQYRTGHRILLFDDEHALATLINSIMPTFIFKGEEYRGQTVTGASSALVVYVPMLPGVSTTKLIAERG